MERYGTDHLRASSSILPTETSLAINITRLLIDPHVAVSRKI